MSSQWVLNPYISGTHAHADALEDK